jgi:hypothetical protein
MLALLMATLIGVFITPDGIVVGADTALSNIGGQVASQQKYCITGPRSVATMQGSYLLEDTVTKATAELNTRFRELCAQVSGAVSPMTLRQQAEHLADALRADLVAFLERLPAADVASMYSSNAVVARVGVSGYSDRGPESLVLGIGVAVESKTNRWEVQVRPLSRLTLSDCGVKFHGQEAVVSILQTDTGVRISRNELQQPDVAKLSSLLRGNCADVSVRSAQAMFVQAVRLTMTLGPGFGVPPGAVSLPIDIVVIPRDGPIDVTRVTSW